MKLPARAEKRPAGYLDGQARGPAADLAKLVGKVDSIEQDGRIEAVATTRRFGFMDDIVICITPRAEGGSRIDIRSVSRVGKSDLGTNAARVPAFRKTFPSMGGSPPRRADTSCGGAGKRYNKKDCRGPIP